MTNYENFFKNSLSTLKNQGNYRTFADLEKILMQKSDDGGENVQQNAYWFSQYIS